MKIFDANVNNTTSSLARKKARLIFADFGETSRGAENTGESGSVIEVKDPEIPFTLYNYPNVFCREQVDIGARFMLKALPNISKPNQTVIDLGCGNGILGTSLLNTYKDNPPTLIYVDESYMAIASAKATLNHSEASNEGKAKATFLVSHCLDGLINNQDMPEYSTGIDYVICNPPFHQQSTVIDDIAWQMFVDAKKVLRIGGELRIVGNRHLDHHAKLSKLFGACSVVASDKKFVVLSAIKRG
jgi:16S rRNA (guanine1207-N2)-methyltransferase/23S rRNA (guanine1835-N2)-methyltransferase